ncbi:MAG TPA: ATP-binding protein [Candidatus Acidoferrales bacterium]|jgi:two-component system sensor histidine kinase FlrB|nr:ATP-binding protein [Candidatus Acidoferrales bacterium]
MKHAPTPTPANRRAAQRALAQAFASFTQVAGSLEQSYEKLQAEVSCLRAELERANSKLTHSLEENTLVRRDLSRTLEGLPCGVVALDASGTIRIINPEARRLLMLSDTWKPGCGQPLPDCLATFLSDVAANESSAVQEFTLASAEQKIFVAVTKTRLSEGGEAGEETILIVRDVTEEKRIASEREASRRVRALAELSTLLAHEIRNPLGSLELFAGLIADATGALPDARQWVNHLQAGLRGLAATVNNVLSFHSEPSPALAPTNLERLLRETTEFLKPLAQQRNMQITLISRIGELRIAADPHRLQQVFFNLSLNAFRAMSAGGALFIRMDWAAGEQGRKVQIDFEDRGTGIQPEHLAKLFTPGFSTTLGSPGLGLTVCKTVVEQHAGTIAVKSAPGRGSTFSVFFPLLGGI